MSTIDPKSFGKSAIAEIKRRMDVSNQNRIKAQAPKIKLKILDQEEAEQEDFKRRWKENRVGERITEIVRKRELL